jgi:hypothetical protein
MIENPLTHTGINWRARVKELRTSLELLQNELVEAEARLAERLAAIHAFEFELRRRIEPFVRQLEALEAKIKQEFRRLEAEWQEKAGEEKWSFEEAAATGDYRYHDEDSKEAPQKLDEAQKVEIKQLYRQLARRFHPDMGVDQADRVYRTQMMMAINAAYTAGDIDKLQALALEPNAAQHLDFAQTDEQVAEAIELELGRLQRRLEEITQELGRLDKHRSTRLMQRKKKSEAAGRNFFAELIQELREKIFQKEMDLEWLQSEEVQSEGIYFDGFEFDDDLSGMDTWYDDRLWHRFDRRRNYDEDDILDDSE